MLCDFAAWLPITANYRAGGMGDVRGFVPHVQVGTGSLHGFFSNPATKASAHFWCSKTGMLEQYVDTADVAWAEGAGNTHFVSCEFEGQVDEPMTSQQLDMGGHLIAWVHQNVGQFPLVVNENPNGEGITPHYAGGAAWGGHSCPGSLRFQQYPELVLAALRYLDDPTTASEADMPLTPDDIEAVAKRTAAYVHDAAAGGGVAFIPGNQEALARIDAGVAVLLANPAHLSGLTDADFAKIAKVVNDESARRQAN